MKAKNYLLCIQRRWSSIRQWQAWKHCKMEINRTRRRGWDFVDIDLIHWISWSSILAHRHTFAVWDILFSKVSTGLQCKAPVLRSTCKIFHLKDKCFPNLSIPNNPFIIQQNSTHRPCLISTSRRRSNSAWSAPSSIPRGSKKPRGAWAPSSFSKAFKAEEEVLATGAGAKAAAEAMAAAKITDFMVG